MYSLDSSVGLFIANSVAKPETLIKRIWATVMFYQIRNRVGLGIVVIDCRRAGM
jgi:hypothetical protein